MNLDDADRVFYLEHLAQGKRSEYILVDKAGDDLDVAQNELIGSLFCPADTVRI